MACPLETSPPKEKSTAWLRRLNEALELNINSAGLGGTVFTPVPNAEHVLPRTTSSHCCPANLSKRGLALWEPLRHYGPWQSWGGPADIQCMETTMIHQKAAVGLKPSPGETGMWDRGTRRPSEDPEELQKSRKYGQPGGLNAVSVQRSSGRFWDVLGLLTLCGGIIHTKHGCGPFWPSKPTRFHPTWSFVTRRVGPSCILAQLVPPPQIILI